MANDADRSDVAERVFGAIEALVASSSLGLRCEYEYLPTEHAEMPCVSVQTLAGDPVERRYLDGSAVMAYRFALVLRQAADDTRQRLDAQAVLRELSGAVAALADPNGDAILCLGPDAALWGIAKTSSPARIQAQSGCVDYQVTLAVKYKTQ